MLNPRWFMRGFLYFVIILFLEITCGSIIYILYWLFSSLLFNKDFSHSRINEAIYYILILLPPFIYCWLEYLRLKKGGVKKDSVIYLYASIAYLVGGFVFMLTLTGFYLLGNWSIFSLPNEYTTNKKWSIFSCHFFAWTFLKNLSLYSVYLLGRKE